MNTATMPDTASPPDLGLFREWCTGDVRAGNALSRRYSKALRRFFCTKVRPEDADDLVQQVWLALGEARARDAGACIRTTLRAYIYGIARHVLFAHIRGRHRLAVVDPIETSIAALDPSISRVIGQRLHVQQTIVALQSLPLDTQILLELRYFDSMSTLELASLYEVPAGTIKSRLANARKLLDSAMQNG